MIKQLCKHELLLKMATPAQWLYPIMFYVMVMSLYPLVLGNDTALLKQIGVVALWVCVVLATLLGSDTLFRADLEQGLIEQIAVSRVSLVVWVIIKVTLHWLTTGFILAGLSFFLALALGLSLSVAALLTLSVMVATPILTWLSALVSALLLSYREYQLLLPLIAIPLQIPVLIFAVGLVLQSMQGISPLPVFCLLLGMMILSIISIPFIISYCLKLALAT